MSEISNENQITAYIHCRNCFNKGIRQHLAAGWTPQGLQIWCEECDSNMAHIDFEGRQHPANTTRALSAEEGSA